MIGKIRSQRPLTFWLGTVILLLNLQHQAAASVVTETGATNSRTTLEIEQPAIVPPELPPLGEPDRFLPTVEIPIRLVIKLSDRRVYVYQGDRVQTSYPVAIGKAGWETPTGTYQVRQLVRNPAWEHPWTGKIVPPGPTNPLGTRWIGFWTDGRNHIGFHGTPNEELIGQAVSHGCVRMRDRDVQALFNLVTIGTPVTVQP